MHTTHRALTPEERDFLTARLDAILNLRKRRRRTLFGVLSLATLVIFLGVFAVTREIASGLIMSAIGLYFSFMVWGQRMRSAADIAKENGEVANLEKDLSAGVVTMREICVRQSLQVDSSSLGTYEFYLDIGEGKVLFLAGQYLTDFVATKQFPPQIVRMSICEHTKVRWELSFHGGLVTTRMRVAKTPPIGRKIFRFDEGSIQDADFAVLATGAYFESAPA